MVSCIVVFGSLAFTNSELSFSVYHDFRTQKSPLCKVCAYTSPANFMPQLMRVSYIRRVRAKPLHLAAQDRSVA